MCNNSGRSAGGISIHVNIPILIFSSSPDLAAALARAAAFQARGGPLHVYPNTNNHIVPS